MIAFNITDVLKKRKTRDTVISAIKEGRTFVYPTDTVYGLGCDAMNIDAVKKIRKAKSTQHPFSVIAPSVSWIRKNFVIRFPEYIEQFPGPVTLILEQREKILPDIVSGSRKVGIRIPDHPFTEIIQEAGTPFITTSANISREKTTSTIKELPETIKSIIDIAIDSGKLGTRASKIIDLTKDRPLIIRE